MADRQLFSVIDNDLLSGYAVTGVVEEEKCLLNWKGAKIPYHLWREIISFMKASYAKNKSEATGRLLYHEVDKQWQFIVLPQKTTGMHVDEEADATSEPEFIAMIKAGWDQFGTAHHHCTMTAFQSGGDAADELTSPGLHITVGHVDQDAVDLDARFVFRGFQYKTDLLNWVEIPELDLSKMPGVLRTQMSALVQEHYLHSPEAIECPVFWLDYIKAPVVLTSAIRFGALGRCDWRTEHDAPSIISAQPYEPYHSSRGFAEGAFFPEEIAELIEELRLVAPAEIELLEHADAESVVFSALVSVCDPQLFNQALELLKKQAIPVEDYYTCVL